VRTLLLGIVLLLAGLAASWAQDVAAPWINAGEAQMGSAVTFRSDGGRYRVISSGPARPGLEQTKCTLDPEDGGPFDVLGGVDVNAIDHFGVSRVLGFEAPAGDVELTCRDRFVAASTHGRFQVVAADGPVSIAVYGLYGAGVLLLLIGGLRLWLAFRAARAAAGTASGR
jgi:hypothetical protein